eukprot:46945_1
MLLYIFVSLHPAGRGVLFCALSAQVFDGLFSRLYVPVFQIFTQVFGGLYKSGYMEDIEYCHQFIWTTFCVLRAQVFDNFLCVYMDNFFDILSFLLIDEYLIYLRKKKK